jgi:hypothetical protein
MLILQSTAKGKGCYGRAGSRRGFSRRRRSGQSTTKSVPGVGPRRHAPKKLAVGWHRILQGNGVKDIAVVSVQNPKINLAKVRRIREQHLEHALKIARRAADDAQHLGSRRLLLQRLAQLAGEPCDFLFVTSLGSLRSRVAARQLYRSAPLRLLPSCSTSCHPIPSRARRWRDVSTPLGTGPPSRIAASSVGWRGACASAGLANKSRLPQNGHGPAHCGRLHLAGGRPPCRFVKGFHWGGGRVPRRDGARSVADDWGTRRR